VAQGYRVLGLWLWTKEEIIVKKEHLAKREPQRFPPNSPQADPERMTNALDNERKKLDKLFERPGAMKRCKDVVVLMSGMYAAEVSAENFVSRVHVANEATVENPASRLYKMDTKSMVPRVFISCYFNPDT
jgi:hypothetical protein